MVARDQCGRNLWDCNVNHFQQPCRFPPPEKPIVETPLPTVNLIKPDFMDRLPKLFPDSAALSSLKEYALVLCFCLMIGA